MDNWFLIVLLWIIIFQIAIAVDSIIYTRKEPPHER